MCLIRPEQLDLCSLQKIFRKPARLPILAIAEDARHLWAWWIWKHEVQVRVMLRGPSLMLLLLPRVLTLGLRGGVLHTVLTVDDWWRGQWGPWFFATCKKVTFSDSAVWRGEGVSWVELEIAPTCKWDSMLETLSATREKALLSNTSGHVDLWYSASSRSSSSMKLLLLYN